MEHLAILKQPYFNWILSGEKTIESRWYKFKRTPWKRISSGDIIYLKETGKDVNAKTEVEKVLFFDKLNLEKITKILEEYGKEVKIPVSKAEECLGKNYCILVFLKKIERIKPFKIDKKGYGLMSAWITLEGINQIKI